MSVAEPAERSYRGYRFPPEIIAHAVWLYFRFQIQDAFPDGVFFVSLGEVKDASLVAPELAKALGTVETGPNLEALLIRRLVGSKALIVLDTFEHLTPSAPLVYALLLRCPEASFLVTSRSALRLRGEHEFVVPA